MVSLFAEAQTILRQVVGSPALQGIVHAGTYTRRTPPTPEQPVTVITANISAIWDRTTRYTPIPPELWKASDRIAVVSQEDVQLFGKPRSQDMLRIDGIAYEVVSVWDETVGLFWHLQVRN